MKKKIPKHCLHKNIKQHNCSKSAYSAEESEDFAITGTKQLHFETLKQKTLILNDNNFIVLFCCIFDQIKAAQVNVREFCQKHLKSYRLFWMVGFLIFSSSRSNPCGIFFFQQTSTTTKNAKQDAHIETWCTNYLHFLCILSVWQPILIVPFYCMAKSSIKVYFCSTFTPLRIFLFGLTVLFNGIIIEMNSVQCLCPFIRSIKQIWSKLHSVCLYMSFVIKPLLCPVA